MTRLEPEKPPQLYQRPLAEPYSLRPAQLSRTTVILALTAWLATVALAFMLGRASMEREANVREQSPSAPPTVEGSATGASAAPAIALTPPPAKPKAEPAYPHSVSTIPREFQGAWDEIVTDKCFGREARYTLRATTLENFEVVTDVERVKIVSPTEIEISVTGYDGNKNQFNDTIGFRLLDGGKTITGTQAGSNFYRRCPKA